MKYLLLAFAIGLPLLLALKLMNNHQRKYESELEEVQRLIAETESGKQADLDGTEEQDSRDG